MSAFFLLSVSSPLLYLVLEHDLGNDFLWGFVEDISKSTAIGARKMSDFVAHAFG